MKARTMRAPLKREVPVKAVGVVVAVVCSGAVEEQVEGSRKPLVKKGGCEVI